MFSFHIQYDASALVWFALTAGSLVVLSRIVTRSRARPVKRRLDSVAVDAERASAAASGPGNRSGGSPPSAAVRGSQPAPARRGRQAEPKPGFRERMMQAGLYSPNTYVMFQTVRLFLLAAPIAIGYFVSRAGWVTMPQGIFVGLLVGVTGTLLPMFWLDHLKSVRQNKIRRALPDALDVISVCLQGGLSLSVALSHVARELNLAHPALAAELNIMERQIQMGRSTGDAMREMANRFDLDELRSMSSVITQAERIGASVATALELFADSMRVKRHQRAEEQAHKAAVKLLIPTLFFVFPAVFVVILGPAVIRIYYQVIPGLLGLR